ncbi:MAG: glycosyltransferase family 4 protein [Sinobacterium sp.]
MLFLMDHKPPVHGMSNINHSLVKYCGREGLSFKSINTAPSYAAKYFSTRYWGVIKFVHSVLAMLVFFLFSLGNFKGVVYRPINGGAGQVYDLFYILISKLFGNKLYIHHHSFNYLNAESKLFSLLNKTLGDDTVHVVLGDAMGQKLSSIYGVRSSQIRVVSNLAFFDIKSHPPTPENTKTIVIGHLANLCCEKGLDVFLSVCKRLTQEKVNYKALLAGPFANKESANMAEVYIEKLPDLEYLGGLYGEDKDRFYQSLDCFIFPSIYKNEAEPLVLYEAAESGVFLIGTDRGCMGDVLNDFKGYICSQNERNAFEITSKLVEGIVKGHFDFDRKSERISRFAVLKYHAEGSLSNLINELKAYETRSV